ncbi:hypothetical protein DEU56DRAFT_775819 [Suillus clintonianus]|uniref:uncharacterized protein n=1 Tax=Suillus clintonianus TaxID=1904413 RepID=UPI001B8685C0|nr:uncharacterized protein DEU56DRAFT_775819 [Suillus clintonianus]KAG2152754.1 hypothetical protein DEU56DRAFT_775819 [Suillus clintonianus]
MAQSGGHWHPNPQLMQQQAIPHGWKGTWPPPAGVALPPNFPGPPPMPPGANTHPHWKAGFWQYNPAHNMNAGPGIPWAPGMGWAQNVPANFNPYKRVPRPASPSYWRTQLSDNGLGLQDMVPARTDRDRESTRDVQGDAVPQTPWIWNPPSLLPTDGPDRATPTKDFNNRRSSQDSSRSNSTPTSFGPPRRGSQDSHNTANTGTPVRDYFYSHPASRQGSLDSLIPRSQGLNQQTISSSTPPPPSSHGRMGSIYSSRTSSFGPQYVPPFPAPPSSAPSTSTATSSLATRIQQPLHAPMFTREPESFTITADLQPTFTSNAVRTPTHYQGTRRYTDEDLDHPSRSSSAPHASASRGLSVPEPLSRHHSLPTTSSPSSMGFLSAFTEDMASVLSPLINPAQRSVATGSLSRSRTEPVIPPAHLTTIPESMSSSTHPSADDFFYPLSVPADSDEESPEPSPSRDRVRTREMERERERDHGRRRERSQEYERANRLTPYNTSSRPNPLPPPPMERPNPAASAPPHQSPEPAHYTRRVRKGFWNRRGDYLTANSYVVYAPEDKAYPAELQHYPNETEGYKDQYGAFVPYLLERPELPASLPYHGRPPAQPYDSFVVYSYH